MNDPTKIVSVAIKLDGADAIAARLGIDEHGKAQEFHTANVLRRIEKYLPMLTGAMTKITVSGTDVKANEIVSNTPYAGYVYNGRNRFSGKKLNYTKLFHPLATDHWDRALVAAEGAALIDDLENFIKTKT